MNDNWNETWKNEANQAYWNEPDKAITGLLGKIDKAKVDRVLDLGCGVGRHSLLFAKNGFNVTAVDSSSEALDILRQKAAQDGIRLKIIQDNYARSSLFPRNYFDLIIAFNVLYHGERKNFEAAVHQMHSWLKPNGMFFFTCPTRRDAKFGSGEKVAPNTYKPLNSIHPGDIHYFSDEADILDLTRNFSKITKNIKEHHWDNNGVNQFSSYWQVTAVK